MWGCAEIRFGGPNDETIHGHPLHGKGLAGYGAHKVVNSAWIEEAIKVNSVHPHHSDAPFRQLHHYALLFHDEMLEALAWGIESRLVPGTVGMILEDLACRAHRAAIPRRIVNARKPTTRSLCNPEPPISVAVEAGSVALSAMPRWVFCARRWPWPEAA